MSQDHLKTPKTTVRRLPSRGHYTRETIYPILDSTFLCHIACTIDEAPYLLPTAYGRAGDYLYVHGSVKNRMLSHLATGAQACICVTLMDALVLARSIFHHSMNYRSVVIYAQGEAVEQEEDKLEGLRIVSDHILPGRWDEVRPPSPGELQATSVIRFAIEEASAKIRTGPPKDNAEDHALDVWAGLLPLQITFEQPVPDPLLRPGITISSSIHNIPSRKI